MATETGGPDSPTDQGDDFVDADEELEPGSERQGFLSRTREKLSNAKSSYAEWHKVDEDKRNEGEGVAGTNFSRRGVLAGAAQLGVAGFIASEATDGDSWNIDWNSNGGAAGTGTGPSGEGVAPPAGNETDGTPTENASGAADGDTYAFETEQALIEDTGLCYPGESGKYMGAIDASEVEMTLEEGDYMGDDPSGALNAEEVSMDLEDITVSQGLYAVDVDRKQGNDGDYDLFVQLVGQEEGGLYLTQSGADKVSNMEFEETFAGYHECN